MAGRAKKGTLIAKRTATAHRPVELIDGDRLCDLLKEYGLGVVVEQRIEEDIVVEPNFFNEYD